MEKESDRALMKYGTQDTISSRPAKHFALEATHRLTGLQKQYTRGKRGNFKQTCHRKSCIRDADQTQPATYKVATMTTSSTYPLLPAKPVQIRIIIYQTIHNRKSSDLDC